MGQNEKCRLKSQIGKGQKCQINIKSSRDFFGDFEHCGKKLM